MSSNISTKHKYNIVFLIDSLGWGGAERMMVPILKDLSKDDFSLRVCVFQEKDGNPIANDLRVMGIPVDFLPIPYLRELSALPRLWQYLRKSKADLVHTQLEFADTLGNFAATFLQIPSVCTLHTLPSQETSLKSQLHQRLEWTSLRLFCNRVIAVSDEARAHYLKITNIRANQMITIYNGIDMTHFDGEKRERARIRRELGIPLEARVLTTVAVLREPKGIQFMLRAMPEIIASSPHVYYLIVGSGPYESQLINKSTKIYQRERIIFAGMRNDIEHILSASDIFVLPTLTEALPTVLAEAMSSRLPIIASVVGGIPEMVRDGKNGLLVSPGDPQQLAEACISLLNDNERCQAMGEAGWQITRENFDVQRQVEHLRHLYLELFEQYER